MVLTKSMSKPGPRAMAKLKRVLRYMKGTVSIGITNGEDAEDGDRLTAYVDPDHAGDQDKGYSTTFSISQVPQWTGVYKANGGGHLNGRSRIRRHVQGVRDGCWTYSHHCQIPDRKPSKRSWNGEFRGFRICVG